MKPTSTHVRLLQRGEAAREIGRGERIGQRSCAPPLRPARAWRARRTRSPACPARTRRPPCPDAGYGSPASAKRGRASRACRSQRAPAATLVSGSLPSVYSRCASMTTTVESDSGGGAVTCAGHFEQGLGLHAGLSCLRMILVRNRFPFFAIMRQPKTTNTGKASLSGAAPTLPPRSRSGILRIGVAIWTVLEPKTHRSGWRRQKRTRRTPPAHSASRPGPRAASLAVEHGEILPKSKAGPKRITCCAAEAFPDRRSAD